MWEARLEQCPAARIGASLCTDCRLARANAWVHAGSSVAAMLPYHTSDVVPQLPQQLVAHACMHCQYLCLGQQDNTCHCCGCYLFALWGGPGVWLQIMYNSGLLCHYTTKPTACARAAAVGVGPYCGCTAAAVAPGVHMLSGNEAAPAVTCNAFPTNQAGSSALAETPDEWTTPAASRKHYAPPLLYIHGQP